MRSGPSHGQETERDGNVLDASAVDPQFAYLFASLITDFSPGTGAAAGDARAGQRQLAQSTGFLQHAVIASHVGCEINRQGRGRSAWRGIQQEFPPQA
jgi:hypothetical protein